MPDPPQVCGEVHMPQSTRPPHPSASGPQFALASAQVIGTHVLPHTYGVPPPPQVWPIGQVPQSRTPPQPLPAGPHWMFWAAQVVGVQPPDGAPHAPGVPPPPQV
jgi:hypothetical protein